MVRDFVRALRTGLGFRFRAPVAQARAGCDQRGSRDQDAALERAIVQHAHRVQRGRLLLQPSHARNFVSASAS